MPTPAPNAPKLQIERKLIAGILLRTSEGRQNFRQKLSATSRDIWSVGVAAAAAGATVNRGGAQIHTH